MINIAVLGSTRGTSLQPILDALDSGALEGVQIKFILSDRKNAGILERARKHGQLAIYLSGQGKSREEYDSEITKLLKENGVELILLIGYMRLMSDSFVEQWRNQVMNIHPSLLPAFAGGMDLNVHEAVLKRGCKVTGATLMFIDEGADTGPIIDQRVVPVMPSDTADTLKERVQKVEGEMLLDAVEWWRDGRIKINGTIIHVTGTD